MSHHKYAKLATFKVAYQTFRDSRPGLRHVMDVDLRGYLTHNLETGARLAAENEVKVHDKNMARTLSKISPNEKGPMRFFGKNKRPFMAATIKTFMRESYELATSD